MNWDVLKHATDIAELITEPHDYPVKVGRSVLIIYDKIKDLSPHFLGQAVQLSKKMITSGEDPEIVGAKVALLCNTVAPINKCTDQI